MLTDIMVDVETTGTDYESCAIIQLAAVKFNLETQEVSTDVFDKCPAFAPKRYWQEGGREFWQKMPAIYKSFVERQEPVDITLDSFIQWVSKDQPDGGYRFWAKPLSFDWPFVEGYFRQYGKRMPFHYRTARDVNSYISGLRGDPSHIDLTDFIPFEGEEHNGLWDAFYQINMLFYAQKKWGPVNVS